MSAITDQNQQEKATPENGANADSVQTKVANLLDNATIPTDKVNAKALESSSVIPSSVEAPSDSMTGVNDGGTGQTEIDPLLLNAVKIKGRAGGVSIEIGEGEWEALLGVLDERLSAADGFFRGARVLLDVGARLVMEDNLRELCAILEEHEMKLGIVHSGTERTLQAAIDVGLSTSFEEEPIITPSESEAPPAGAENALQYFVYRGNLRSGQVLRKVENIVVLGDINPGAQVISSGDIFIWGRLRGVAFAGAEGDKQAIVTALEFSPTQLRIADLAAIAPQAKKTSSGLLGTLWQKEAAKGPEVAYVHDNRILVEPWDKARSARRWPQNAK